MSEEKGIRRSGISRYICKECGAVCQLLLKPKSQLDVIMVMLFDCNKSRSRGGISKWVGKGRRDSLSISAVRKKGRGLICRVGTRPPLGTKSSIEVNPPLISWNMESFVPSRYVSS